MFSNVNYELIEATDLDEVLADHPELARAIDDREGN